MSDAVNSFPELIDQNYMLVINHSSLLNAIFFHCGISELDQKNIYYLLAEYNNKLTKSQDASKENRISWFKDRLPQLNLNEHTIERLLNFLLKSGEPEKVLSELRTLTKSDSQYSKLAREAINQLKLIINNLSTIDLKVQLVISPSFVLPVISHPYEYSGFLFQLLVRRKNNRYEYDILASGGRYDQMISKFRNKQISPQCAVGLSFDFEKIVFLINEKSKQNTFRSELVVCSISDNIPNVILNANLITTQTPTLLADKTKKINQKHAHFETPTIPSNSLIHQEVKNRLRLFRQISLMHKNHNISTHMIHEKFSSVEDMDEYCKKHCINAYSYIKENSILFTSQIFAHNSSSIQNNSVDAWLTDQLDQSQNLTLNNTSSSLKTSPSSQSFLKIRSLIDKGFKFLEKKFNLNDFLVNSNKIINSSLSVGSFSLGSPFLSSNPAPQTSNAITGYGSSTSLAASLSSLNTSAQSSSYLDFVNSLLNPESTSSTVNSQYSSSPATTSSLTAASSSSTLNSSSQLNVTFLLEPSSRQQSTGSSTRKKLEIQIVSKINHIFSIFNSKTRIELIIIETHDNVIQALANGLHLEMEEQYFNSNWNQCLEKINNSKYKRQLCNFRLDEIIRDLRYVKRSKVFILYSYKSEQFKLLVAP